MNNIKWGCIQPLTGGMYLGAEEAIGRPAEWILSFNGLNDAKIDENGKVISAANEYNILEYLKKHNRCPKYYQIMNRGMFDSDIYDTNLVINRDGKEDNPDYIDLDLVVAVPVCSGLSISNTNSKESRDCKNTNMLWISNYTLNVIKPKCYVFENAPTLVGSRGDDVRSALEKLAEEAGYSVLYYKTDTKFHENCQRRPRTFVCFFKLNEINGEPLKFEHVNNHINVKEYFDLMDKNATQMDEVDTAPHNILLVEYVHYLYGEDWKRLIKGSLMSYIEKNSLLKDFIKFVETSNFEQKDKDKIIKYVNHIIYKRSLGKNYYGDDICLFNEDVFPAVQFRSINNMLHPSGERRCTVREYLSLMGHPSDFIFYGKDLNKIGQNVPVKTAKFIVEQAIKNLERSNKEFSVIFQYNTGKEAR